MGVLFTKNTLNARSNPKLKVDSHVSNYSYINADLANKLRLLLLIIIATASHFSYACSCDSDVFYPEKMWQKKSWSGEYLNVFLVKINEIRREVENDKRKDKAFFEVLSILRGAADETPYISSFPDADVAMCNLPFKRTDGIREIGRNLDVGDEFVLFAGSGSFKWSLCSPAFKWNDELKKKMERLSGLGQ